MFERLLLDFLNLILPGQCKVCQQPLARLRDRFICSNCWAKVELILPPQCYRCGKALAPSFIDIESPICKTCQNEKRYFYQARAVGYYRGVLKEAVLLLKFGKKTGLSQMMGDLLVDVLKKQPEMAAEIDAILPVPLHWWRRYSRGFNQSELLASVLSKYLHRPLLTKLLQRTRATTPQTTLKRKERLENIKGAFKVKHPDKIANKTLLLVDDVYTTGATVNECAKVLSRARAKRVYVLTLARG